ncbi:MAG: DUF4416 family protein [bacterium]|nr:DUF4416 family protein [bacterium]
MGIEYEHYPVLLTFSVLAVDTDSIEQVKGKLEDVWDTVIVSSSVVPFLYTSYYCDEMGRDILRVYFGTDLLVDAGTIAAIKLRTNAIENEYLRDCKRTVNIDPGYLTLAKFVLATTKDATHRVYIGNKIYAESTLYFQNGTFMPWQWTYPDYRSEHAIGFFTILRSGYYARIKRLKYI